MKKPYLFQTFFKLWLLFYLLCQIFYNIIIIITIILMETSRSSETCDQKLFLSLFLMRILKHRIRKVW